MKLSDGLNGMTKVIEAEGDLEVSRIIITENTFQIVMDDKLYHVNEYEDLIKNKKDKQ